MSVVEHFLETRGPDRKFKFSDFSDFLRVLAQNCNSKCIIISKKNL